MHVGLRNSRAGHDHYHGPAFTGPDWKFGKGNRHIACVSVTLSDPGQFWLLNWAQMNSFCGFSFHIVNKCLFAMSEHF
jgi:hypothetical protein